MTPGGAPIRLSIVAPCYREASGLAELHRRTALAAQALVGDDFELILVNDGSPDATWAGICALGDGDARVVGVNLSRNHGHQLALTAGLSVARGDRILILDADLQDPPELLPQMMQALDQGADVAYGQRTQRAGETLFKRATAAIFYRLLRRLADVQIPRDTGDFRLMSRRVLEVLKGMPESHRFMRGMVSWVGFRQVAVPYQRELRATGASSYPLRKMLRLAFDAITGFSTRPLRLASLLGLVFGALGALGVVITIIAWGMGVTVPGWASVVVILLTLGGIQLAVLGIIGEYLGRLYIEVKRRPLFIIDEIRTRR
jgi:dolichol-phosphate mannosyltransferase